jgi:hypothetical protein
MVRTVIKPRVSYSIILVLICALANLPISLSFIVGGIFELLMAVILCIKMSNEEEIKATGVYGWISVQYVDNNELHTLDIINMVGVRILAYSLGALGALYYIPTALLLILTYFDIEIRH